MSFELLEKTNDEPKYLNFSYLQFFLIIEDFLNNEFVFQEGEECYVVNKNKQIKVLKFKREKDKKKIYESSIVFEHGKYVIGFDEVTFRRIDVNFKMSAIMIYRFGFDHSNNRDWNKISNLRN